MACYQRQCLVAPVSSSVNHRHKLYWLAHSEAWRLNAGGVLFSKIAKIEKYNSKFFSHLSLVVSSHANVFCFYLPTLYFIKAGDGVFMLFVNFNSVSTK